MRWNLSIEGFQVCRSFCPFTLPGMKMDLVTPESLHPLLSEKILRELIYV